ncbi:sugar lactone lactonase YvrE [Georgenia soli]|uniref:Sugar lactone lactonase YvrE n=1 Tax=Georgenia soli TaxID=638953 RepID=A0A2A9ESH7_9MICO|nr:SMP-30/gluconolactonase/LRE family protein [Georgenia soli]PFG41195.1 sugar lactone lactonase YvrE [Georgenia soli]
MDRSHLFLPALAVALSLGAAVPATAHDHEAPESHGHGHHRSLPDRIELPVGFQPEGIAAARHGATAWVGSLADGDILQLDLRTGDRELLSEGPGTPSVGMTLDRRGRLFVAGGPSGQGRVVSTRTGEVLATYRLATGSTFINDVTILDGVAWFTDSSAAVLHGVPLGHHGRLPGQHEVVHLKLRGAWRQVAGFNANGIASTPDGEALLVANSALGTVFRVDPQTGEAREVDLPDVPTSVRGAKGPVAFADGLLRQDRTLYVVQNTANQVAVLRLDEEGERARLRKVLKDENFDAPTTAAIYRDSLYLPSARFGTPQPTRATYWVTRVDR